MISIAIDGPAGAGKSTIAKKVAQDMGFIYVDTGALYRTIGLYAIRNNISFNEISLYFEHIHISIKFENNEQKIYLNDQDVSEDIRMPKIAMAASQVSAIPAVREFLLHLQRDIAKKENVIMDGRDIGTVILPNADLKIFLTASIEDRALRRYAQHQNKGIDISLDDLKLEIQKRDESDYNRKIAPLKKAEDGILIDTTGNTFDQSVEIIKKVIKEKLKIL